MYKEIIACVIIIMLIIGLDVMTQNYTRKSVAVMSEKLDYIKEAYNNDEDKEIISEKFKELEEEWHNIYEKVTFYLEHNELEKVETRIANIRADVETEEKEDCIASIEECKYVLEHIEEKEDFKIQNIF